MANFLDMLAMGLQGAGGMVSGQTAAAPDDQNITVTGKPLSVRNVPEDTRSVKAVSKKQEQQDETPELIKRKGRFGVSGLLRDIIGTVGDSYLLANGKPTVYAPQRDKEKLASAQYGLTDDPNAAIERVGELDSAAARDLYKAQQAGEVARTNAGRQQANLDRQTAKDAASLKYRKIQIAQNMMNSAKTPEEQKSVRDWLDNPDADMDNLPAHIMAAGGINRSQQELTNVLPEKMAISKQNANANTTRANRPPAARAAPNPTAASMIAPMVQKLQSGQPLTAGEQKVYDDLRPSRGKSKRAIPPIDPSIFKR